MIFVFKVNSIENYIYLQLSVPTDGLFLKFENCKIRFNTVLLGILFYSFSYLDLQNLHAVLSKIYNL